MYRYVTDTAGLTEAIAALEREAAIEPWIALDTETYSDGTVTVYKFWDPYTNKIRLVQLKGRNGIVWMIDLKALGPGAVLDPLIAFLRRQDITWVGHNLKFDFKMLAVNLGVHLAKVYCTLIAGSIVGYATGMTARRAAGLSLKDLMRDLLGKYMDKEQQTSYWGGQLTTAQLDYAAADVEDMIPLADKFREMFRDEYRCEAAVDLEMEALPAVCRMELNGILLDSWMYRLIQRCAKARIPALLKELCEYFGVPLQRVFDPETRKFSLVPTKINFDSNRDVMALFRSHEIIVENLQADTIEPLSDRFPILKVYLEYKALQKQLSVDYEAYVHPVTGRIHSTFNQNGAATGRFACTEINMQQVSKYDVKVPASVIAELEAAGLLDRVAKYWSKDQNTYVLNYRYCFIPRKGYKFVTLDYSGQEIAIMVALSNDPFMIEVLKQPKKIPKVDPLSGIEVLGDDGKVVMVDNLKADLHSQVAAKMFKIDISRVKEKPPEFHGKSYRDLAKAVCFGLAYGKSAKSLAEEWGISEAEGEKIVREFFEPMPVLYAWLTQQGKIGMATKLCIFALGRWRFLNDSRHSDKKAAERAAKNTPIQGAGALMMKKAMTLVDAMAQGMDLNTLIAQGFVVPYEGMEPLIIPVSTVHDELNVEVREDLVGDLVPDIERQMLDAADVFLMGKVKGEVGIGVGDTWTK